MKVLVLVVLCTDHMGIEMTFRCAGHAVLNKKCDIHKPLTWLRPSRESSLGTAVTDRLARSLLDVFFWLWQDTVSSGVSASVTVDLLYHIKAMQTNCTLYPQLLAVFPQKHYCLLNANYQKFSGLLPQSMAFFSEHWGLLCLVYIDKFISTTFLYYSFWRIGKANKTQRLRLDGTSHSETGLRKCQRNSLLCNNGKNILL